MRGCTNHKQAIYLFEAHSERVRFEKYAVYPILANLWRTSSHVRVCVSGLCTMKVALTTLTHNTLQYLNTFKKYINTGFSVRVRDNQ